MSHALPLFDEASPHERRFLEFHAENPAVYSEIVRLARQAKAAGKTRYSTRTIVAVLRFRWDIEVKPDGGGYRINDHFTPYYARLIMEHEPDLTGFFELRETVAERGDEEANG